MEVSKDLIVKLREKTQAGMMDCKSALVSAGGDLEKAVVILREKGIAQAVKKSSRTTKEGMVGSYIHMGGKIGVLVEINCETDFVARTPEFRELVEDISMHIAATNPQYIEPTEIPSDVLDKEMAIYQTQAQNSGKPENAIPKIVEGKLSKYKEDVCLLEQPFVKEPAKKVKGYITEKVAKFGENITVKRFTRYQLGEDF